MQETEFISQNKDKWKEFEDVLRRNNKDPERVTELFIETTDDLSYSRTFYSNRSVRVYLNGIAQQVYQVIYKNKKREKNAFLNFWRQDLPNALWYNRNAIYFAFILFISGVAIGLLSSMYYPDFAKIIMGEQYIEMTKANIEKGDPMAVYKSSEPIGMFFEIGLNNIIVSSIVFVAGLMFGVGTMYYLLYNAIMVGAFIYFFIERDLFRESFLAIMLHGTLELSMIVMAGAAGFALSRGLLFPGTYSRGQALIQSARDGVKMLIGVIVLLIYAAFIESFLTRHTDMGDWLRLLIILMSAALVVGYFVVYPFYRYKQGLVPKKEMAEIPQTQRNVFRLDVIKTGGKIFTESFDLFTLNARKNSILAFALGAIITIVYGVITKGKFHLLASYDSNYLLGVVDIIYPWDAWDGHFNFEDFPFAFGAITVLFALYGLVIFSYANRSLKLKSEIHFADGINFIFISAGIALFLLLPQWVTFFLLPFFYPFFLLWMYVSFHEKLFFPVAIRRTLQIMSGNYWRMIGVFLSAFIIQWITFFIFGADISDLVIQMVTMNIPRNAPLAEQAYFIVYTFLIFFVPACVLSLSMYGTALFYFSAKEINEANHLKAGIHQIGFKKRAYGLEQEV
jgi:uncharacterized membrane protein SpoIIM required for sporulation